MISKSSLPDGPPSNFRYLCHPLTEQVIEEVDNYFLEHWPFPNERARQKYLTGDFSAPGFYMYPQALNDRIHLISKFMTITIFLDDDLEHMSFEEGSAYNEKFLSIARGDKLPDRSIPAEYLWHDLWETIRSYDPEVVNDLLETTAIFMKSQVEGGRAKYRNMGDYYEYREKDVGQGFLSVLMRFGLKLKVSAQDLENARPFEKLAAKHFSIINDLCSFKKEILAHKSAHEEGGALCNSVQVLAGEAGISTTAAKRVLLGLAREWELHYMSLMDEIGADPKKSTPELMAYLKGLEYQISGNEHWSNHCGRYGMPG